MAEVLKENNPQRNPASFRDPNGFIFEEAGRLFRHVARSYRPHYDMLMSSGLYEALVSDGQLVAHQETDPALSRGAYKLLEPVRIPFISYPYEWCFDQLRDAALLTLSVCRRALQHGMVLQDASAYNVQFIGYRPVFIDLQSFAVYEEGSPWEAYRQFCQHFLAPLLISACCDRRLNRFSSVSIDGIPLDLASRLLPAKTYLNFSILMNIHLHAMSQRRFQDKEVRKPASKRGFSKAAFFGLLDQLQGTIEKLSPRKEKTEWEDYYDSHNYTGEAFRHKKDLIERVVTRIGPQSVWDLGANAGVFSRLASARGIATTAFDLDDLAVAAGYRAACKEKDESFLSLTMDLGNPSPSLGWNHKERSSLVDRGPADLVLALALVHHLAVSNNVPFEYIARFLSRFSRHLMIEFVPKSDPQVQRLLASRRDIFEDYTEENFRASFDEFFSLMSCESVGDSGRKIFTFSNRLPLAERGLP